MWCFPSPFRGVTLSWLIQLPPFFIYYFNILVDKFRTLFVTNVPHHFWSINKYKECYVTSLKVERRSLTHPPLPEKMNNTMIMNVDLIINIQVKPDKNTTSLQLGTVYHNTRIILSLVFVNVALISNLLFNNFNLFKH